jgi:hypothetical protein
VDHCDAVYGTGEPLLLVHGGPDRNRNRGEQVEKAH